MVGEDCNWKNEDEADLFISGDDFVSVLHALSWLGRPRQNDVKNVNKKRKVIL